MTKTIPIPGLNRFLAMAHRVCAAVASDSTLKLSDNCTLNLPADLTLAFAQTSDSQVIRVSFAGVSADIHEQLLKGWLGRFAQINGREPVTYLDVGPNQIKTTVANFLGIVLVDAEDAA